MTDSRMIHRTIHIQTELSTDRLYSKVYLYFAAVAATLLLCGAPSVANAATVAGDSGFGSQTITLDVTTSGAVIVVQDGTNAMSGCTWNGSQNFTHLISESTAGSAYAASAWILENPAVGTFNVVCSGGATYATAMAVYESADGGTLTTTAGATDTGTSNAVTIFDTPATDAFEVMVAGFGQNDWDCVTGCVRRVQANGSGGPGTIFDSDGVVASASFDISAPHSADGYNAAFVQIVDSADAPPSTPPDEPSGGVLADQPINDGQFTYSGSAVSADLTVHRTGDIQSITLSGDFTTLPSNGEWHFTVNQGGWIRNLALTSNGSTTIPVSPYTSTNGQITILVYCLSANLAAHSDPDDGTQIHCPITSTVTGSFTWTLASSTNLIDGNTGNNQPFVELNGDAVDYSTDTTHIVSYQPETGETVASSSPVTLSATIYVREEDYTDDTFVQFKYFHTSNAIASSAACEPECVTITVEVPVTSAGLTTVSTTTDSNLQEGTWDYTISIISPDTAGGFSVFGYRFSFGTVFESNIVNSTFIVGQQSGLDRFIASTTAAIDDYIASSTISLESCSSFTSFSLGDCLAVLLLPQWEPTKAQLIRFRDGFLQSFPLGYATRFMVLAASPPSDTLPPLEIDMPCFLQISCGYSVNLTPWAMLLSTSSLLSTATNPDTGDTLYEIVEGDPVLSWSNFIYMLALLTVVLQLLGLGRAVVGAEIGTQTESGIAERGRRISDRRNNRI